MLPDLTDMGRVLKVLYGCMMVYRPNPFFTTREQQRKSLKEQRRRCELKLLDARRRRNAWELSVHQDHLVVLDAHLYAHLLGK